MDKILIGLFGKVQKHFPASCIDQFLYIFHPPDISTAIQWNINDTGNLLYKADGRIMLRISFRQIKDQQRIGANVVIRHGKGDHIIRDPFSVTKTG